MSQPLAKPKSRLLRLIVLMLCGVGLPCLLPPIGDRRDIWISAAPYPQAIVGALIGLVIEWMLRTAEASRSSPDATSSKQDVEES
jgi:hypothetical protein